MRRDGFTVALFLLFFCCCLQADSPPTDTQLATELIASEDWEELLKKEKNRVTPQVCNFLLSEGKRYRTLGEFTTAMKAYRIAESIAEQSTNKACLAQAIRGVGIVLSIHGDTETALVQYEESLSIAREIGDETLVAHSLRSIGVHHLEAGDDYRALSYLQESLAMSEKLGDPKSILPTLLNLGVIHVENGNFAEALRFYTRMLSIKELKGSKDLYASTLNNIAIIYDNQGDPQQALEYYERSLKIRQEMGDKANIANVLNNMGDTRLISDENRALEYNKMALAVSREIGDRVLEIRALSSISTAYRRKGDLGQALKYSEESLRLAEEFKSQEMLTGRFRSMAQIYLDKGDYAQALEYARKASDSAARTNSIADQWSSMEIQARVYRALGEPGKAMSALKESIAIIEDWRSLIAGDEIEVLSHFAEKASVYYEMIDLLVDQKNIPLALHYAERVKSRALLDVLHSGKAEISRTMTPAEIEEEKNLQRRIVELNDELQEAGGDTTVADQLHKARLDFESFRTKLYVNHPELRITRGEASPVRLEDLANQIDPATAMLEFVVTEQKTYLFVISHAGEKPATNLYTIPITRSALASRVRNFRKQIAERDLRIQIAARDMYQLLLAQAGKILSSKQKWLLIPDDILWELPFQVLQPSTGRYLLQDHAVGYAPSLTVYYEMLRLRQKKITENPTLLAFGNPEAGKPNAERLAAVYRDEKLGPLPEAEKEVTTLKTLYGDANSRIFTGTEAREDYFKRDASNYAVLHFATHGILNDTTPLYSQILLTQGDGSAKEDGLLEAWEIMSLQLNAELVVLSACETALGRVRRGEGMIGLTWAFFIAGAPSTLVSQWKVNSKSTTELMLEFHKQLKAPGSSLSHAEAIRKAALKLMQNANYSHPFYWGPFIVIGTGQ